MTARVFNSTYTYSFPVSAGRVFLRLFFYPSSYGARTAADALFGVTAGGVTLLRDFNASQTVIALDLACLVREFSLNVSATSALDVTFTPSSQQHYAFVNGIEVVPAPADLFNTNKPVPTVGRPDPTPLRADTAFQTMYRLNVGGAAVLPSDDSAHLYRTWADDSPYILGAAFGVSYAKDPNVTIQYGPSTAPPYAAPESVYATARSMGPTGQVNLNYNLTWVLPYIDAGFYYLVRLHLCEIQYPITKMNQRVFDVYVNNRTAEKAVDVVAMSGGIGRPVLVDYLVVTEPAGSSELITELWVEMHPDVPARPQIYDAILNGLEVFKLQTYHDNSLAGPNPPQTDALRKKKKGGAFVAAWAAGGLAAVFLGCLCAWAVYRRKKKAASSVVVVDVPVAGASQTPDSPPSVVLDQAKRPYAFDTAR
ncbi:hypothetical protein PR202_ga19226 [Eleusine coracana subsp. coracana]|uniref:Malectin-like domain-containing protein n=1 Tax=Eleusine coracana subsp. coracana TaxID=191504 RepID=A0AAV5CTY8_ELECO|nr:hypothetical protein PR202_ga19226 [Eleusine coracana subsp. coracana]